MTELPPLSDAQLRALQVIAAGGVPAANIARALIRQGLVEEGEDPGAQPAKVWSLRVTAEGQRYLPEVA